MIDRCEECGKFVGHKLTCSQRLKPEQSAEYWKKRFQELEASSFKPTDKPLILPTSEQERRPLP
jgi:hypothetical protein